MGHRRWKSEYFDKQHAGKFFLLHCWQNYFTAFDLCTLISHVVIIVFTPSDPLIASVGILDDKEKLKKMQCFDKESNTI